MTPTWGGRKPHRRYHAGCFCSYCDGVRRTQEQVAKLDGERVAKGLCRHCGGPVPCSSWFGDSAPGVRKSRGILRTR